jgi:hypothetical protein
VGELCEELNPDDETYQNSEDLHDDDGQILMVGTILMHALASGFQR